MTAKAIGITVIALVLVVGIPLGIWGLRVATADFFGQGNQEIETNRTDFRIPAYDRFFDLCSQVQSDKQRLESLEQELDVAQPDADRREQIFASMTAIRNGIAENVNQYNVDSAKEGTVGQFKASELPYRLETEGDTECVV